MDKKQPHAFERKVKRTIEEYGQIKKKDKVIVACSGGKDSTACLYVLHKLEYDVEALAIDLHIGDYSRKNIENIKIFCKQQGIRLHLVDLRAELGSSICYIRSSVQEKKTVSNCTVCGVVKRWLLNKKARELHADKLATGHNLNDESETVLMNLLKGNPLLGLGMGPKTGYIEHSRFVQRIKPLYFCTNEETRGYCRSQGFPVVYEPCPCSEGVFRRRIRGELAELEKTNPNIRLNLVKNFLKLLPALRAKAGRGDQIRECELCGEPSRNRVCQLCGMMTSRKA